MNKLKVRFTKWYIKRGYKFEYDFDNTHIYRDGFINIPWDVPKAVFTCPWWVKPLLIFFSPSVYSAVTFGELIADAIAEGIRRGNEQSDTRSAVIHEYIERQIKKNEQM